MTFESATESEFPVWYPIEYPRRFRGVSDSYKVVELKALSSRAPHKDVFHRVGLGSAMPSQARREDCFHHLGLGTAMPSGDPRKDLCLRAGLGTAQPSRPRVIKTIFVRRSGQSGPSPVRRCPACVRARAHVRTHACTHACACVQVFTSHKRLEDLDVPSLHVSEICQILEDVDVPSPDGARDANSSSFLKRLDGVDVPRLFKSFCIIEGLDVPM